MRGRWLGIAIFVMVSGCATGGGNAVSEKEQAEDAAVVEYNATVEPEERVVCTRERVSGTNIARKICRTERQIEEEREHAREAMDEIRRTVGDSSSGGVGG